jgi:hypothetical protein
VNGLAWTIGIDVVENTLFLMAASLACTPAQEPDIASYLACISGFCTTISSNPDLPLDESEVGYGAGIDD